MTSFENTAKIALAGALIFGGLATNAPARAEPVPSGSELHLESVTAFQRGDLNLVYAVSTGFTDNAGNPAPVGTTIKVDVSSCGNFLQSSTLSYDGSKPGQVTNLSPSGAFDGTENSVNKRVGQSLDIVATIAQSGYDSYTRTTNFNGYSVSRPSCAKINGTSGSGDKSCAVKIGAKKVGQARVGRTVKVRAPRTTGDCGRISYTWKASGKVIKRAKALTINRDLRGKKLIAVVKLTNAKPTVLWFGRVK